MSKEACFNKIHIKLESVSNQEVFFRLNAVSITPEGKIDQFENVSK